MTCRKRVGRSVITFPCDLTEGHSGPCCAVEIPTSVHARQQWEAQGSSIREFQSAPMPTGAIGEDGQRAPHPQDKMTCPECDRSFFRIRPPGAVHYCVHCGSSFHLNDHGMEVLLKAARRDQDAPPLPEPEMAPEEAEEPPPSTLADHVAKSAEDKPDAEPEVGGDGADVLIEVRDTIERFLVGKASRSDLHDLIERIS